MAASSASIVIFCDGACSGNPGPGGWGVVLQTTSEVRELGGSSPQTTNNQMELQAAIEALRSIAAVAGKAWIGTDSNYVVKGITEWIHGWRRKEWRGSTGKPVANREYWETLLELAEARGKDLHWQYVQGHAGIAGNERADEIAAAFAQGEEPDLYQGPVSRYSVRLEIPSNR